MSKKDNSVAKKLAYKPPILVDYGDLRIRTGTNVGGPGRDGGTPPAWKGTPATGGGLNIDPNFFDDSEQSSSGSGQNNQVFD